MDTVNGLPALADSDPASLIGQYSRDMRTALTRPALTDGACITTMNTGSLTNAKGIYDPTAFLNRSVDLRMQVAALTVSSGGQNTNLLVLAAQLQPANFVTWAGINAAGVVVMGLISSGGQMSIRWASAALSSSSIYLSASYPAV